MAESLPMSSLGLAERRVALGLSTAWLAALNGVSESMLLQFEEGESPTPQYVLDKMDYLDNLSSEITRICVEYAGRESTSTGTSGNLSVSSISESSDLAILRPALSALPPEFHEKVFARANSELSTKGLRLGVNSFVSIDYLRWLSVVGLEDSVPVRMKYVLTKD